MTNRGNAGKGRPKGSANKATKAVQETLAEMGYDPIAAMVKVAVNAEQAGDIALAGKMAAELAQYVAPKRKAVEHSGEINTAPVAVFKIGDKVLEVGNKTDHT